MNFRKYKEYIIHAIIWLAGFIIVAGYVNTIGNVKREMGHFIFPVLVGTIFSIILFYTVSYKLIGRYSMRKSISHFISELLLIFFGLTILETLLDYIFFPAYYSTEKESLFSQFMVTLVFNLFILAIALGYGFVKMWLLTERQQQELKNQKLAAELDFLKAQINPHVLFNMLNMAYSSATTYGDERTADIIEKTSSQLRYVLYDSNTKKVSVRKELNHIEGFIALQKMRISSETPLNITLDVYIDNENYEISPLLLIPFIENAFKYGISISKKSEIKITIKCVDGELQLHVSNPVILSNENYGKERSSGIGLENVRKRLNILYPSKHFLEIRNDGKNFIVNLSLNLT